MICCLPPRPGYASVRRIDWMISLIFRSNVRFGILDEARVEQPLADELLGDRRRAAAVAAEAVDSGRDDRERVEAGVVPERLVLDGGLGVDDDRRDVVERDDLALLAAEAGELDLPVRS